MNNVAEILMERDKRMIFLSWAIKEISYAAYSRTEGFDAECNGLRNDALENFRGSIQDAVRNCYEALFHGEKEFGDEL